MSGDSRSDDDMPVEIDFSGGARGKFYRSDARLGLPLYIDPDVQTDLIGVASARGVTLSAIANDLLKKALAALKAGKQQHEGVIRALRTTGARGYKARQHRNVSKNWRHPL
jgi:hypothetical protein